MTKYLLITKSLEPFEIIEAETLDDALQNLIGMKYPAGFISLTVMEEVDGPY